MKIEAQKIHDYKLRIRLISKLIRKSLVIFAFSTFVLWIMVKVKHFDEFTMICLYLLGTIPIYAFLADHYLKQYRQWESAALLICEDKPNDSD